MITKSEYPFIVSDLVQTLEETERKLKAKEKEVESLRAELKKVYKLITEVNIEERRFSDNKNHLYAIAWTNLPLLKETKSEWV